jgi:hypothetical protein
LLCHHPHDLELSLKGSVQQQDFPGMLSAGYFRPISSRVAVSVVGIDNDRKGRRSGYQVPPGAVFLLQCLLNEWYDNPVSIVLMNFDGLV